VILRKKEHKDAIYDFDSYQAPLIDNSEPLKAKCESDLPTTESNKFEFDLKTPVVSPSAVCTTAIVLSQTTVTDKSIAVNWPHATGSAYRGYTLSYRDKNENVGWYPGSAIAINSPDIATTITQLTSGHTYEIQVEGTCSNGDKTKSNFLVASTATVVEKPAGDFSCGQQNGVPAYDLNTCGQQKPGLGAIFKAADFDIVVDKSDFNKGLLALPMADYAQAEVELQNVELDANSQMCRGQVVLKRIAIYPLGKGLTDRLADFEAKLKAAAGELNSALDDAEKVLNEAEKYFAGGNNVGKVKTGKGPDVASGATSVIIGGQTVGTVLADANKPASSVFDNISHTGPEGTAPTAQTFKGAKVTFKEYYVSETDRSIYDFDAYNPLFANSNPLLRKYELLKNGERVASKCIMPGTMDKVTVVFEGASALDQTKIRFVNKPTDGTKPIQYNVGPWANNTATLTLGGGPGGDAQEIYALYKDGDTEYAIGKLLLPSYTEVIKNLVLIPVAKTDIAKQYEAAVKDMLKKTYGRIGVTWNVSVAPFYDNDSWDTSPKDGKVQVSGSTAFSNDYVLEERALVQNYSAAHPANATTAYLFILPEQAVGTSAELLGKMPHQEQFGFIFAGAGTAGNYAAPDRVAHTVAHELGHGAHFLDHPFHPYLGLAQGGSDNLMDYRGDTQLWKLQWDQIHDPGHVWGVFKRDQDALAVENNGYVIASDKTFLDPTGRLIKLPKDSKIYFYCISLSSYPNGALYGFKLPGTNGVKYKPVLSFGKFGGYKALNAQGTEAIPGAFYLDNNIYNTGSQNITFIHKHFKPDGTAEYWLNDQQYLVLDENITKNTQLTPIKEVSYTIPSSVENENIVIEKTPCSEELSVDVAFSKLAGFGTKLNNTFGIFILDGNGKKKKLLSNGNLILVPDFEYTDKATIVFTQNAITKIWSADVTLNTNSNGNNKSVQTEIETQIATFSQRFQGKSQTTLINGQAKTITEDGGESFVANINYFEGVTLLTDIGVSVYEDGTIPKSYWKKEDPKYANYPVHAPPTVSGVADGVVGEITDIPQLVKMGCELATDQQKRDALWNAARNVNLGTIKKAATGTIKDYWDRYTGPQDHNTRHDQGVDAVTVASVLWGGFAKKGITKVDDGLAQASEEIIQQTITKLSKKLDDLGLDNLKGKVNNLDPQARKRFYQDISELADDELSILDDNKELFDEWLQINRKTDAEKIPVKENWWKKLLDGKKFEKEVYDKIKNADPAIMTKLSQKIPDLNERTILKQVYFCINKSTTCNKAGEYFISDLAFVKQLKDAEGAVIGWDVVIADTKLSEFTSLTTNQNKAKGLSEYVLKSVPNKVNDDIFEGFGVGTKVARKIDNNVKTPFLKIFSDGKGVFSGINEILP